MLERSVLCAGLVLMGVVIEQQRDYGQSVVAELLLAVLIGLKIVLD